MRISWWALIPQFVPCCHLRTKFKFKWFCTCALLAFLYGFCSFSSTPLVPPPALSAVMTVGDTELLVFVPFGCQLSDSPVVLSLNSTCIVKPQQFYLYPFLQHSAQSYQVLQHIQQLWKWDWASSSWQFFSCLHRLQVGASWWFQWTFERLPSSWWFWLPHSCHRNDPGVFPHRRRLPPAPAGIVPGTRWRDWVVPSAGVEETAPTFRPTGPGRLLCPPWGSALLTPSTGSCRPWTSAGKLSLCARIASATFWSCSAPQWTPFLSSAASSGCSGFLPIICTCLPYFPLGFPLDFVPGSGLCR